MRTSCVWAFLASGSGEKDVNSLPTFRPAQQGSLPRVSSHMPSELLLHFFFLVFFKALVVGISAWCPWIVALLFPPVVSYKYCLVADAIFPGAALPLLSRPSIFYDTTIPGRSWQKWGH